LNELWLLVLELPETEELNRELSIDDKPEICMMK
jgi:hypothetical protein